jgi:hypothetical protein
LSLLPFFEWCNDLAMSQAYRESLWLFALTQALHLVAVTTFIGAILIGDLRLLGWGPVGQSRAVIARSAQRILLWAGLAVLATGIPQFTTNAAELPEVSALRLQDVLPRGGVVFTATLRRRVAVADEGRLPSWGPEGSRRRFDRALDGCNHQRPADHFYG